MSDWKKKLGTNINEIMLSNGLTMYNLGEILGTSSATVCRWINGESAPTLPYIIRIMKNFDITFDDIAKGVDVDD